MSNQYKEVASILVETIEKIKPLLTRPEDEMHSMRLVHQISVLKDQLLIMTGNGDVQADVNINMPPATTIAGVPVGRLRKFTEAEMIPADDKAYQYRQDIDKAMSDYFNIKAEPPAILANVPDLVVRGIAKKAGIKGVTSTNPAVISIEFIESIYDALDNQETKKAAEPAGELPFINVDKTVKEREADADKTPLATTEEIITIPGSQEKNDDEPVTGEHIPKDNPEEPAPTTEEADKATKPNTPTEITKSPELEQPAQSKQAEDSKNSKTNTAKKATGK